MLLAPKTGQVANLMPAAPGKMRPCTVPYASTAGLRRFVPAPQPHATCTCHSIAGGGNSLASHVARHAATWPGASPAAADPTALFLSSMPRMALCTRMSCRGEVRHRRGHQPV